MVRVLHVTEKCQGIAARLFIKPNKRYSDISTVKILRSDSSTWNRQKKKKEEVGEFYLGLILFPLR